MEFNELVALLVSLGGVGAVVAMLINVGKSVGFVKDGQAPAWRTGLNILGLAVLFLVKIFKPDFDVAGFDAQAAQFAAVASTVVAYLVEIGASELAHKYLKGVPLIGKSFSG